TGIEFPGETAGIVRKSESWSDVGLANISFGHGVAVSAIQLAAAYRVLATDGVYLAPRVIGSVGSEDPETRSAKRESRRVLSRGVTARVQKMMRLATGAGGTGARAQIDGYAVAGKTGTAQKIDRISGGYSDEAHVAVFAGFVPAEDPAAVIVVVVDEPKPVHGGGKVAAPVFAKIAAAVMREFGRIPDDSLIAEVGGEIVPEEAAGARPSAHEAALQAAVAAAKGGTPSFIGMTAQQAVERYARASLRVPLSLRGSGVVVGQKPRPGQPAGSGLVLTLATPGEMR
ncbi:MAG: penicillin-binding transpeptidase domain-containing protein, partial [Myxococcota bacterium]